MLKSGSEWPHYDIDEDFSDPRFFGIAWVACRHRSARAKPIGTSFLSARSQLSRRLDLIGQMSAT